MPAASASGEIFSLSGDARYEGVVRGRVGGGAELDIELEAAACHGIGLEASARALADANAALSVFLGGRATGVAFAAAGLRARAQLAPNIFERLGLVADIAAYAEAAAGGRLAVGLDFGTIEALARDELDGLELELLLAFAREVTVEAGAWGRVSASVMAAAYVEVAGTLGDGDDSGFSIAAGASVGLGAGAGADFYARLGLTDPRRLVDTTVDLLTRELARQAREVLPDELVPGVELIELLLPVALRTAYDIGQLSALGTLAPPEQMVEPFLRAFADSLQRWALDKLVEAGGSLLSGTVEQLADLIPDELHSDQRDAFGAAIEEAIEDLRAFEDRDLTLDDVVAVGARLVTMAEAGAAELVTPLREPIAALWCALACVNALRDPAIASVSGSVSVGGGGGASGSGAIRPLPPTPPLVREALGETLGRPDVDVGFGDAVDFLIEIGLADFMSAQVPVAGTVVYPLADTLGISVGEIVTSALRLRFGEDVATLPLYRKLRDYTREALDGVIATELLPRMRSALGPEGRTYVEEVADPCLRATSTFVLERLDALIGGVGGDDANPFLESLSAGASTLVYRLLMRNVLFFDHVLFSYVLDSTSAAFSELAQSARSDSSHVLVATMETLLPVQWPTFPGVDPDRLDPIQDLVAALALAGRDAFGPAVWTHDRRRRLRELKQALLIGFEGEPAYDDAGAVEDLFRELILCDYVPNETALEELAELLGELIAAQMQIVAPRAALALAAYALAITRELVEEIDEAVRAAIAVAVEALQIALAVLEEWGRLVREAIEAVERAARELADALDELADALTDSDVRDDAKDALYGLGASRVEDAVRTGFPGDPSDAENVAVTTAIDIYRGVFWAAEPLVDAGLDVLAGLADDAGEFLEGAADAADALEAMFERLAEDVEAAVRDAASDLGIPLPGELSPTDVANEIADALPTEFLLGLLDDAIAATGREQEAIDARVAAEWERNRAQEEYDRRREAVDEARPGGPTTIEIPSPIPLETDPERAWTYGPAVPTRVRIGGATRAYFRGPDRRVRIALNGQPIHTQPSEWVQRPDGRFELTATLSLGTHPLVPGPNVLEVSVANGEDPIRRETVVFLVDPNAPPLPAVLELVPELCRLDAPGNDHERVDEERVTLRWSGSQPLPVERWRIQDQEARHVLSLGDVAIPANDTLTITTGGDPDASSDNDIYWGRRAAVWNNTGDTVRVIDAGGVLRAEYVFEPPGG